MEYIEIKKDI